MKIKKRHIEIAVGLVLLAGAIVGVLFGAGVFQDSAEVAAQKAFAAAAKAVAPRDAARCPVIPPGKRLIEQFASQRRGCASVTEGVTHVVLTYADLATLSFQLKDVDVLTCVSDLHKRCIYVLGGIGGDKAFDTSSVAADAVSLVNKFKLDGISVHDLSSQTSTLPYMTALSTALKASVASTTLSYDVFYSELDKTLLNCGTRCFADGVQDVVDWITVLAYSVSSDPVLASDVYADAISGFFDPWKAKLQGKLNIGVCIDCGYGPGPTIDDISIWANYSQSVGGMSVYGTDRMYAIQAILRPMPLPLRSSNISSSCGSNDGAPRVVLFWGSEVGGCESIPRGVTHVIMSFSLVQDGNVTLSLQGNDATLRRCVLSLQQRCIKVLVSIGGETNSKAIADLVDFDRFATSAVALVDKFNFDGVDMDDETRGKYDPAHVIAYMTSLSNALRPRDKLLTIDAFYYDAVPDKCAAVTGRCFPKQVEPLVDWVHVMAYNVDLDVAKAQAVYASAINDTFSAWTAVLPPPKMVVAVCTEASNSLYRGCAFGPGPSLAVVTLWTQWSRASGGGMALWAGSKDQFLNYTYTTLLTG